MFITPIQLTTTMNSSHLHTHGWASGTTAHLGFSDVHRHLEDSPHSFDDMAQGPQVMLDSAAAVLHQPKAKVLFQFFDGWPMSES